MSDQLSLGIWLRDQGIKQVEENAGVWKDLAFDIVCSLPAGEWDGGQINMEVERRIGKPHHPNAYGALIMRARNAKVLYETGRYRRSGKASCHAHKYQIYMKG